MNGFRTSLRIKSDYFPTQNDQQSFVMETRCLKKTELLDIETSFVRQRVTYGSEMLILPRRRNISDKF
jgi:hypothetical protein